VLPWGIDRCVTTRPPGEAARLWRRTCVCGGVPAGPRRGRSRAARLAPESVFASVPAPRSATAGLYRYIDAFSSRPAFYRFRRVAALGEAKSHGFVGSR
jgi:hypothetical protein